MRCPRCGYDNPEGAKFCIECAALLSKNRCPQCGVENLPQAKFCAKCAAPLTGQPPVPSLVAASQRRLASSTPKHLVEKILTSSTTL